MADTQTYKQILTKLIQKQILLTGKTVTLDKIKNIHGLRVEDDGTVTAIGDNVNATLDQVLEAFTDFPSLVTARQIIEAKSEQAKRVREQIASGWLQIESEKAHLTAAIESISLGFITTNQDLKIITQNSAVERILGPSQNKAWTINEIQSNITGEFFLPLLCKKCIELGAPLPPDEVKFKDKRLRIFISPIKTFNRGVEEAGVTIVIENLE